MKKLLFLVFFLLVSIAYAHEEEVSFVVDGYRIEFVSPGEVPASTGVNASIAFRIENSSTNQTINDLDSYVIMDPNIRIDLTSRGNGTYYAEYKFLTSGTYEIHSFVINGQSFSVDFHISVLGPQQTDFIPTTESSQVNYVFYAIPLLGLIGASYFVIKKRTRAAAGVFILSLIITGLAYSVSIYYSSGAAVEGIIVCNPNDPTDCTWQAHIHTLVILQLCDKEPRFETEVGLLNQTHTHEERNVLHWHDRLPYDSTTGQILDTSPLRLDNSLRSIGFSIANSTDCYGVTKIFVNKENYWAQGTSWTLEDRTYVWKDRDIIYIAHGNRTVQEVLEFLQAKQFSFPTLGPA